MPLLKAFVCQVFGFVLYNYLSEPLLEAKILPENIANPVLAATIAFLCFLLQLYTDKNEDGNRTGDSLEKEDIKTSAPVKKESASEAKSTRPAARAQETDENKPSTQKQTLAANLYELEMIISAGKQIEGPFKLQDTAVVQVDVSSEKFEIYFVESRNDVITESTVLSDSNGNVPIKTIRDEIISTTSSESLNKETDEIALEQSELSVQKQSTTCPIIQETSEDIEKSNVVSLQKDSVLGTIEASLGTETINDFAVSDTNAEQMRKASNEVVDVTESLNMTTKRELHTEDMDSPKSFESKETTLNGFTTEVTLTNNDIKQTIPTKLEEIDSEIENEIILDGIILGKSFVDKESQDILKPNSEESNIEDFNEPEVDCDETIETVIQSKSTQLVLEDICVPTLNGILPKSFNEEPNEKLTISESLYNIPTETVSTLDKTPKGEIDIMKLIQTELNDDSIIALSDNLVKVTNEINVPTSNEEINYTKDAFESNSTVIEFSTKESNSSEIVVDTTKENIVDNAVLRGQEALASTVIRSNGEIHINSKNETETLVTDDENALLMGTEDSKPDVPVREAVTVSEDDSKTRSTSKLETAAMSEMICFEKHLPVDVTFVYSCLPQSYQKNNSCDNCIVLDSKGYIFKFLDA